MIETLIGTALGGAFRLAPEILKWLDRKNERAHELSMLDKQYDLDKLHADSGARLAEIEAGKTIGAAEIQALIEGAKAQAVQTGIKWVDALNSLVRPLMAFQWLLILWPAVVVAGIVLSVQGGVDALTAIKGAFGTEEKALASSIASFFLLDRSLRRAPAVR